MTKTLWKFRGSEEIEGESTERKDSLAAYFRRKLRRRSFIANIFGEPGSGKSWAAISLCEDIDTLFSKSDVAFGIDNFYESMLGGTSKVRLMDDFGSELDPHEHMLEMGKATNHFFQKMRTFKTGLFITTPNRMDINKNTRERRATFYMEVVEVDEKKKMSKVKVQRIQVDNKSGMVYYHNLKLSPSGQITDKGKPQWRKIKYFWVQQPTKQLRDWYLPFRDKIAKKQLEKSALSAKSTLQKIQTVPEITDAIMEDISEYLTPLGKLNKARIQNKFNVGSGKIKLIADRLDQEGFISHKRKKRVTRK